MRARLRKLDWSYIVIELLIVTGGVLIALALDQWIQSRHERAEAELLLRAVRTELQSITTELEGEMAFRKAMSESVDKIFAMAAADVPPPPSVLDPVLGDLLWYSDTDFPIGAIDSILVGGKLRLIENEEVRYFIASLPGRLEIIKKVELQDYSTQMDVIAPYYRTHASLPQLVSIMAARPGSTGKGETFFPHRPKETRDHSALLKDTEFLGIAVQVAIVQSNVVDVYNSLIPDLNRITGLLDQELND
jgi:hypothetical protein